MIQDRLATPMPARIRALPKDPRGYPIFYIALIDTAGQAHFTINDSRKSYLCHTHDLCHICGTKLLRFRWFVGGPGSAFDEHGTYIDGPVHHECMRYAMQVCPYLAMPSYKRIGERTRPDMGDAPPVFIDPTMIPQRPPVFVAGMCAKHVAILQGATLYFQPERPYRRVEYWVQGRQITDAEAGPLVEQALAVLSAV